MINKVKTYMKTFLRNKFDTNYDRWKRYQDGEVVCTHLLEYCDLIYPEDIGHEETKTLQNGEVGIFYVISLQLVDDWGSRDVRLMLLGYQGKKRIRECSFEEYVEIYCNK